MWLTCERIQLAATEGFPEVRGSAKQEGLQNCLGKVGFLKQTLNFEDVVLRNDNVVHNERPLPQELGREL